MRGVPTMSDAPLYERRVAVMGDDGGRTSEGSGDADSGGSAGRGRSRGRGRG